MSTEEPSRDSKLPSSRRNPDEVMKKSMQQGAWFVWLALAVVLFFYFTSDFGQPSTTQLAYTEFLTAVDEGKIEQVTLRGQKIEGRYTEQAVEESDGIDVARFETLRPQVESQRLLERLEENGIQYTAESAEPPWWAQILLRALPWVLLLGVLFWFWNRMAQRAMSSGAGPFGFGQSKAKRFEQTRSDVEPRSMSPVQRMPSARSMKSSSFSRNPNAFASWAPRFRAACC